jgi:gluconolactonase
MLKLTFALTSCFLFACSADPAPPAATGGSSGGSGAGMGGGSGAAGSGGAAAGAGGSAGSGATAGSGGGSAGSGGGNTGGTSGSGGSGGMPSGVCPPGPYGAPLPSANPMAAKITDVNSNNLLEGALWVESLGVFLFSEMNFGGGNPPPSTIHQHTLGTTSATPFIQNAGSNGLALTNDGQILAATYGTQDVSTFDLVSKQRTPYVSQFNAQSFKGPNDLTVRSDGNVYFSDPDYQNANRPSISTKGVYRVSPTKQISEVDTVFHDKNPNGVALSPDENTLYVAADDGFIRKYAVAADGSVTAAGNFAGPNVAADGFAVDCAGNLYAADHSGGKFLVFDAAGMKLGEIQVAGSLTNAAFGGPDRRTLFITAGSAIYSIQLNVPGYPY